LLRLSFTAVFFCVLPLRYQHPPHFFMDARVKPGHDEFAELLCRHSGARAPISGLPEIE
jgi:hypothetical protein